MKTTLNLRDDLVRRAKARAALRGQPLAKYIEEKLELSLLQDEEQFDTVGKWLDQLPHVSESAANYLTNKVNADDFRSIDEEMWK